MLDIKVSSKLQGGIGNVMFQIACAYGYSLDNNISYIFSKKGYPIIHSSLERYYSNILANINILGDYNFSNFRLYSEVAFHYNPIISSDQNLYLIGGFQSEKYFIDHKEEIRKIFNYEISAELKKILPLNGELSCSIHVRRGDYLKYPKHHPVQDIEYYKNAISLFKENIIFLVFSDDIEWCKQNFKGLSDNLIFVENNEDYEDLYLMSKCNHNIIANSSFSWWGAWLNNNPDKKVIAPKNWFGPVYSQHNTKDLYCEDWIII